MKRQYLLFLFLCALELTVFAQKANMQWTQPGYTSESNWQISDWLLDDQTERQWLLKTSLLGKDKNGFYVKHENGVKVTIERYNNAMEIEKDGLFYLPKQNNQQANPDDLIISKNELLHLNSADIVYFNHQLCLIAMLRDIKTDTSHFYMQTINKETLEFENGIRRIGYTLEGYHQNKFKCEVSPDSTQLLIYTTPTSYDRTTKKMVLNVLDLDLNNTGVRVLNLSYKNTLFKTERIKIDNEGQVYVLAKTYLGKRKERKRGQPNFKHYLMTFGQVSIEDHRYELEMYDKFVSEIDIEIVNQEQIICAGFYSEENTRKTKGICFFSINTIDKEITKRNIRPFSVDFLKKMMREKRAEKESELNQFHLKDIVLRSDGGILLIAEQFYINRTSSGTYYHFHDIFVVNLNKEGNIDWTTLLPKKQIDKLGYFSSYLMNVAKNNIQIIYNDNYKNLKRTEQKRRRKYKYNSPNAVAVIASIDMNGKVKKELLFGERKEFFQLSPAVSEPIEQNKLLIYSENEVGNRFNIGKLTLY